MRIWGYRSGLLAVILAVVMALSSCSSFKEPDVTLVDVDFTGISTDGLRFEMMARVENPNDFSASIEQVEYRIYGDGVALAEGKWNESVPVPARGSVEVRVPFILRWKGGQTILESLFDDSEHEWKFEGSVELKKGPITKTFPFSERGTIHTPSGLTNL